MVGLVASRLKDRFNRPAFAIALGPDGTGTGSGRSLPGVDLGKAVAAAVDAGLLVKGGGHAMAAGITVAPGGIGRCGPLSANGWAMMSQRPVPARPRLSTRR